MYELYDMIVATIMSLVCGGMVGFVIGLWWRGRRR